MGWTVIDAMSDGGATREEEVVVVMDFIGKFGIGEDDFVSLSV